MGWLKRKKEKPRDGLLSHSLAAVVPSALQRFTSRFGMGLGGATALLSRSYSLSLTKLEVRIIANLTNALGSWEFTNNRNVLAMCLRFLLSLLDIRVLYGFPPCCSGEGGTERHGIGREEKE